MRKIGLTIVKGDLLKPISLDKVVRIPVALELIVNACNDNGVSQRPVVSKFGEAERLMTQSWCLYPRVKVTVRLQTDSDS
jgi:hypothetical protein